MVKMVSFTLCIFYWKEGRKEKEEKKGGRKRNVRLNPMRCSQITER